MTDRHAGYVVTLADDVREDDAAAVLTALGMVKGVIAVEPIVSSLELHLAEARADQRWREQVAGLLRRTDAGK